MSLKDLKQRSDKALATIAATPPSTDPNPRRATTAPGATAFMQPTIDALNERAQTAEARVQEFEKLLRDQPSEVEIEALVEVDGRKRRLSDEQFEELTANLTNNPLVHPVSVRRLVDGRFEVVSGHNRVAAFRELGRQRIPVVVVDIEGATADRTAFYANLLQPSLSDFEKYLGFRQERVRTSLSNRAMAKEAGVSEAVVSMLFAFEGLPEAALDAVERNPSAMGMNCAAELARLAKEGRGARVDEAVALLSEGKLTQKEAVAYAKARPKTSSVPAARAEPVKIRSGRTEFCRYVAQGTSLRIDFKDASQREAVELEIAAVLEAAAKRSALT